MDRRNFLKLGTGSCLALSAVSITAGLSGCSQPLPENSQWKVLREGDRRFLTAIIPVILKGSFPDDSQPQSNAINTMLLQIDSIIFNLDPHNKKQMVELLDLLNMSVTRSLTTGVWSQWHKASEQEIDQFLNKWRESSISLFNLAYNGLNRLVCAAWYGLPQSWNAVGYPGPRYANILL